MTQLGIFARTFSRPDLETALDAVAGSGFRTMQFNMALAGASSMPDEIAPGLAARIRAAGRDRGLSMAAVSGTYNMAHPDASVRSDGLRRLGVLVASAAALGTRVVTLCTGSRDPTDMWRKHPDNGTREAWGDMLAGLEAALELAEAHDVTLAFEPERNNVVDSAAAGRRLLDEAPSPHLRVVIDAANLFDGPDLDRQGGTLRAAFDLLGHDIVLAHAKDVRRDGAIVAAGQGGLDYDLYVSLLGQTGREIPLIMHGLAEHEVPESLAYLQAAVATADAG